tara:strand:+ start:136 stop:588 length:453 start_codon:yes stop_codon:yes gene_type:complete
MVLKLTKEKIMEDKELPFFNFPTDKLNTIRLDVGQRNYEKLLSIYIDLWTKNGQDIELNFIIKKHKISEEKLLKIQEINKNYIEIVVKNDEKKIKKYVKSEQILTRISQINKRTATLKRAYIKKRDTNNNNENQSFMEKYASNVIGIDEK